MIKFCLWRLEQIFWHQTLFQKIFTLRKPRIAIFANIINTGNIFIKKTLKTQKKWTELETMH